MSEITSLNNDRVRRVQALQRSARRRCQEGVLVAEGLRLVREALAAHLPIAQGFYTESFASDVAGKSVLADLTSRAPCSLVIPKVMAAMSDTATPQGVLVVLPQPALSPKITPRFILIPDGVRDPGNLGTILRAAWATGVSQVLVPPGTVDFTNPKVVRSAMGAHFHLPIRSASWEAIRSATQGCAIWLAEARSGVAYDALDWRPDVALIVGGEAAGAGDAARDIISDYVYIPMESAVDSLNVAIATAVLLFESARQRRS